MLIFEAFSEAILPACSNRSGWVNAFIRQIGEQKYEITFDHKLISSLVDRCQRDRFKVRRAEQAPFQGFDDYVNNAMKAWDVPGMAIAVVKDDKVVYAKGYGLREIGKTAAVDENTIFAIGSSSKAFTSASIAMLVDEGKLKWDDPRNKILAGLPAFRSLRYAADDGARPADASHRARTRRPVMVRDGIQPRGGFAPCPIP